MQITVPFRPQPLPAALLDGDLSGLSGLAQDALEIYERDRNAHPLIPCEITVWLDDPWVAVIELEAQDGAPVVAGVSIRLRPAELELDHDPQRESIVLPRLPKGGLPLRTLRSLTFGEATKAARESLDQVGEETLRWHGFSREALNEPRRPGKRGHSDGYYAEIAAAYVAAIKRGSHRPVAEVAEAMNEATPFVRDALHAARGRGLLTKGRRGVPGGLLTSKAQAVLRK